MSVLRVGDGRGFVIERPWPVERCVVTAGHCLPELPPFHGASHTWERTFRHLLGRLDDSCNIWAECLFANPIADLAVLGSPDPQEVPDQAEAYETLLESMAPLTIHDVPDDWQGRGSLLSLDRRWFTCHLIAVRSVLWIEDAAEPIRGGMSGSPILNEDGAAVGVVCTSSGGVNSDEHREGGPNPVLARQLPAWLAM